MKINWNISEEETSLAFKLRKPIYVSAKWIEDGREKTAYRLWVLDCVSVNAAKVEAVECVQRQFPGAEMLEINLNL